jgi:hypothetical protein
VLLSPPDRPGYRHGRRRASARSCIGLLGLLVLGVPARGQTVPQGAPIPASACEQAGRDAERQYALPVGLLAAIGRVESGRWDASLGRVVPTPWAIDAGGQPYMPDSKQSALQQIRALQTGGIRNIDVGCFQINLLNHPSAFTDLDQAFDPVANAQYAARFLTLLRARLGTWEDAVAAYHSATPSRGIPYRQLVFANWSAPEGWDRLRSTPPTLSQASNPASPVSVFSFGGTEIRVWTPSQIGTAAGMISIGAAKSEAPLPRVITARE